jgi:hypothetical protein
MGRWGADFDPDRLADLETGMWKAYYRRQPARLFGLLILALREQAGLSWPRAVYAAGLLTKAAVGFARASGDYDRFAPDVARGYRAMGLPASVDLDTVAREELRWWVVRREIGLAAGTAAGRDSRSRIARRGLRRCAGSRWGPWSRSTPHSSEACWNGSRDHSCDRCRIFGVRNE